MTITAKVYSPVFTGVFQKGFGDQTVAVEPVSALVFSDDFSQAVTNLDDITTLTPVIEGTSYIQLLNTTGVNYGIRIANDSIGIVSNGTDTGMLYHLNYGVVGKADINIVAQTSAVDNSPDDYGWIAARYIDSDNFIAVSITNNTTSKVQLWKVVAGTGTLLGTQSSSVIGETDTIKLELRGTVWKVFIDKGSGFVEEISVIETDLALKGLSCIGSGNIHNATWPTADPTTASQFSTIKVTEIGDIPIIPGLIGFGVNTPAGSGPNRSGGTIIHVTTLAASGTGSFKEALETPGPRVVVFDVSGAILLTNTILITEPYITIAFQTAPSPGVEIRQATIAIVTHDVFVHHGKIRPGDSTAGTSKGSRDCINLTDQGSSGDVHDVVIDHCSLTWAIDGTLDINPIGTRAISDVTVSNTIIAECLNNAGHPEGAHSTGMLIGAKTRRIYVADCLYESNLFRLPFLFDDSEAVLVNNAFDNYGSTCITVNDDSEGNGIILAARGNLFVRGVDTITLAEPLNIKNTLKSQGTEIYFSDVASVEAELGDYVEDPWVEAGTGRTVDERVTPTVQVSNPTLIPDGYNPRAASTVKAFIIANCGAFSGTRDVPDAAIIADFNATGGAPTYTAGTGLIKGDMTDTVGFQTIAENTSAYVEPSNPFVVQPSGYNNLEIDLQAKAALVE